MSTLTKKSSVLENRKVKVVPIRREGNWLPKGHDGDFMFTGATFKLCVKMNQNGILQDPLEGLTSEQVKELAELASREIKDFNVHNSKSIWSSYYVGLDKNVRVLDLSNVKDYLDYKVLLTNDDLIAPSAEERFEKGTYRFVIVDEDQEVKEKVKTADKKKAAYKELGKMESSETRLVNFLKVYGKKPPHSVKKEWLIAQIEEVIDTNIDKFLEIVEDTDFELKVLIEDALSAKALIKPTKTSYALPGGDKIGGTLAEAVAYLKDAKNQDVFLTIQAQVEASK